MKKLFQDIIQIFIYYGVYLFSIWAMFRAWHIEWQYFKYYAAAAWIITLAECHIVNVKKD